MAKEIIILFVFVSGCLARISQKDINLKQEILNAFEIEEYQKCLSLLDSISDKSLIENDSILCGIEALSLLKTQHYQEAVDKYFVMRKANRFLLVQDFYGFVADAFKGMRDYEKALLYYDSALAYPSKFPFMLDRAITYNYLGQNDKAIMDCRTLLMLSKDTLVLIGACLNLSDFYLQQDNYDSSRYYIQKTIELKGYTEDALLEFAVYYYKSHKIDSAFICTNKVIEAAPEKPYAYTLRGKLFYTQNLLDSACNDWKRAVNLGGDPEADELLQTKCSNPFK